MSFFFNNNDDNNDDNNNKNNNNDSNSNPSKSNPWLDLLWMGLKFLAKEALIIGGTAIAARMLVGWAKKSNPELTDEEANSIVNLLCKAVTAYRASNSTHLQTSILAILVLLAPSNVDIGSLFNSLVSGQEYDPTAGLSEEEIAKRQMPSDIEFNQMKVDDESSDILINKYGLNEERVLLIPLELRQPLIELLETNPTCPISLEPILDPETGKVLPGFTALFQYLDAKPHVYVFETESIHGWVRENNSPINPVTRQVMNKKEFFELTPEEGSTTTTTTTSTTTSTTRPAASTTSTAHDSNRSRSHHYEHEHQPSAPPLQDDDGDEQQEEQQQEPWMVCSSM